MTPEETARWAEVEQMRVDAAQVCIEHLGGEAVLAADEMAHRILSILTPPSGHVRSMGASMRQYGVWAAHRDRLARYCGVSDGSNRIHYASINRHSLSKAIRELVLAMDRAREGDDGADG